MKKKTTPIEKITMKELESILQRAKTSPLDEKDCVKIMTVFKSYLQLTDLVEDKQMTIKRLRQMLFGSSTEKTAAVIKKTEEEDEPESPQATCEDTRAPPETDEEDSEPKPKRKGHGRNGADAYTAAEKIRVPHESVQPGDACPECTKGKVYEMKNPGVLIRIVGQAPLQAKVYELEKLRCNLCGTVFTAQAPKGIGKEK